MKVTMELSEGEISDAVREYILKHGHVKAGCAMTVILTRVEIPSAKTIARVDISQSREIYTDK